MGEYIVQVADLPARQFGVFDTLFKGAVNEAVFGISHYSLGALFVLLFEFGYLFVGRIIDLGVLFISRQQLMGCLVLFK
ncbi:hypothetical protein SDC9_117435 [bioreactor metagenome]|uniref:Uncharacterized protein n=1 Tax=bioreactor metagenome TaxID=1076179 RepID=A0A645BY98_9ZZZZ